MDGRDVPALRAAADIGSNVIDDIPCSAVGDGVNSCIDRERRVLDVRCGGFQLLDTDICPA